MQQLLLPVNLTSAFQAYGGGGTLRHSPGHSILQHQDKPKREYITQFKSSVCIITECTSDLVARNTAGVGGATITNGYFSI